MSRAATPYRDGAPATAGVGYSVETPTAGWYRFKMTSGGHPVGVRVWFGAPIDPVTGEELDRGWRWQATVNNEPVDLARVWPAAGRDPIDQAEHDYFASLQGWALTNAPDSPAANPNRKVDLLTALMPF